MKSRLLTARNYPASPFGLGAHYDGSGIHFSVFSDNAEKMQLCLFDVSGRHEIAKLDMPDNSDGIWYGYLPDAQPGQLYGYRAFGLYEPRRGHRFNPHKLLLDPYARQLAGNLQWHDALHGFNLDATTVDLSFDRQDSAPYMPKAVVNADVFDWEDDRPPRTPWSDTIIYELHARGFTQLRDDLPESIRGTFAALGHPTTIDYLKRLGITAIELLPIHAFVRDRVLLDKQLTNYWGYNTLAFFAPDSTYSSDGSVAELKSAIKNLHAAGIEVLLDVVYNHTAEGNELGATLSLRGLDNASYYRLHGSDPRFYINDTGCGNTLNFSHPRVIQLALDSLRYWVQEFHIDGFRFDLSVVLGRDQSGFDPSAGFFDALMQDPILSQVKLIAEPWDLGPGGYQLSNHPPRFAEWNADFRDSLRRYWRGNENQRGALAAGLQGSAHLFDRQHRKPWASINFVTAHDGFTLQDLVSYNRKHNDANAENNRDGSDSNDSNNWGNEGPADTDDIAELRELIKRNLLASILCAHGTPMLLAGDEFGRTQLGNNNAYCQDNAISWLDWTLLYSERGKNLRDFTARLLAIRKKSPLLQGHYFQHAEFEIAPGLRDVFWFDERGIELTPEDWNNPTARLLGLRRAAINDEGEIDLSILLCNSDSAAHQFVLPELMLNDNPLNLYRVLFDTFSPMAENQPLVENAYDVSAYSLVLIAATMPIAAITPNAAIAPIQIQEPNP